MMPTCFLLRELHIVAGSSSGIIRHFQLWFLSCWMNRAHLLLRIMTVCFRQAPAYSPVGQALEHGRIHFGPDDQYEDFLAFVLFALMNGGVHWVSGASFSAFDADDFLSVPFFPLGQTIFAVVLSCKYI